MADKIKQKKILSIFLGSVLAMIKAWYSWIKKLKSKLIFHRYFSLDSRPFKSMYFLQTRTFLRLYLGPHKVHVHPHVDVRKLWHRTISILNRPFLSTWKPPRQILMRRLLKITPGSLGGPRTALGVPRRAQGTPCKALPMRSLEKRKKGMGYENACLATAFCCKPTKWYTFDSSCLHLSYELNHR